MLRKILIIIFAIIFMLSAVGICDIGLPLPFDKIWILIIFILSMTGLVISVLADE